MPPFVAASGEVNIGDANRFLRPNIPALLKNQNPEQFPPVYVFNTFNREHQIPFGGKGLKVIKACEPGEKYSEPLKLDAIEIEEYNLADGGGNMSFTAESGMEVALDLIGATKGVAAQLDLFTTNLEWWGVFVSTNEVPTVKELAQARTKLTKMMQMIFDHGKKLAAAGPAGLAQVGPNHNLAAEFLGVVPPWSTLPEVKEERIACPECGEKIMPQAKLCIHCHTRFDGKAAKN